MARWRPCVYAQRVLRRVLLVVLVVCQFTAGIPVSLAEMHDPAGMDMTGMNMTGMNMTGMNMTHCPDHAPPQHPGGKRGCCSDGGCQCAVSVALPAAPPQATCRSQPLRIYPESDIRTLPPRIDLFLRPPIA